MKLSLFDWNGTLLHDILVVYESVVEIFKVYAVPPPSLETYRNEICSNFMNFYWDNGIPRSATAPELNAIRTTFLLAHPTQANLHFNTQETLKLARSLGMSTGIVSAENEARFVHDFERLWTPEYPPLDYVRYGVRDKKAALLETCDLFKTLPQEACYVDDTFEGCTSAREAGLIVIGVTHGYASHRRIALSNPDFICNSLVEVMEILRKIGGNNGTR